MIVFAEADASSLPAMFIKNSFIMVLVWIAAGAGIAVIIDAFRKRRKVEIHPQPLEVRKAPKRFNHDLAESRHSDHERRLEDHEDRIADLEKTRGEFEVTMLKAGEERELRLRNEIHGAQMETKNSLGKLHERINQILTGVARLEGKDRR